MSLEVVHLFLFLYACVTDGVRKEKERLTAACDSISILSGSYNSTNRLLLGNLPWLYLLFSILGKPRIIISLSSRFFIHYLLNSLSNCLSASLGSVNL